MHFVLTVGMFELRVLSGHVQAGHTYLGTQTVYSWYKVT